MEVMFTLFSRYCCLKVGWYYHPPSRVQGVKGLSFQKKKLPKNIQLLLKLLEKGLTNKLRKSMDWFLYDEF